MRASILKRDNIAVFLAIKDQALIKNFARRKSILDVARLGSDVPAIGEKQMKYPSLSESQCVVIACRNFGHSDI